MDARTDVPRTDDFLRTKISWMQGLLNFFTHGAPLSALRARKSSAIISRKEFWVIFPSPNSFQSRRLAPGLAFFFTWRFLHLTATLTATFTCQKGEFASFYGNTFMFCVSDAWVKIESHMKVWLLRTSALRSTFSKR